MSGNPLDRPIRGGGIANRAERCLAQRDPGIFRPLWGATHEIKAAVVRRASAGEIRALAVTKGMRTLQQDGLNLVRSGVATVEEVLRASGL